MTLPATLKKEFRELIPPTLFFFVALHLVALIHALLAKATGIPATTSVSIAVAALILGKAVLIADMLPFINRYPGKPLLYNVLWKTTIYELAALLIHYLEELIEFWRKTGSFIAGNRKLLSEIIWPHFWAIQIMLTLLILVYCTMHELSRAMGPGKLREIFLGSSTKVAARDA
jgi:hypothetical protein